MIDCFEALDEGLFGLRDVAEGDGAIIESTIRHLPINDTIDRVGRVDSSVCSFRLREAASTESAIMMMACSSVVGLGPG